MSKLNIKSRKEFVGYFFIAPSVVVYFLFVFLPIIVGLYYSFTNYNFSDSYRFVGFNNYKFMLNDSVFHKAILNTIEYSVLTIIPQIILGFLFAVGFSKKNLLGKNIYRAAIYLPNVTSMVAISMVWLWIYDPGLGFLNIFLKNIGLKPMVWLGNPDTAMGSLAVVSIWRGIGFNMIVNLGGLQGIPSSLYEAAEIDGASKFKQMISITIPMMAPTTFFLLVINTINSFMVFEQVSIMTAGGPMERTTTLVHRIYLSAFQQFRMGYAMAMAMILFVIVVVVTLLNFRYGNQGHDAEIG